MTSLMHLLIAELILAGAKNMRFRITMEKRKIQLAKPTSPYIQPPKIPVIKVQHLIVKKLNINAVLLALNNSKWQRLPRRRAGRTSHIGDWVHGQGLYGKQQEFLIRMVWSKVKEQRIWQRKT